MSPRHSILLVEDDRDDELLTIRALKRNNVLNDVDVVRDGQEALDYLFCDGCYAKRDPADVPDIVLLDLRLPKLSGHEVLRAIRKSAHFRLMPVVVLTSSAEESDIATSYDLGANSYIRKPVDFDRFSDAVRSVGLYWLVLNEAPPSTG